MYYAIFIFYQEQVRNKSSTTELESGKGRQKNVFLCLRLILYFSKSCYKEKQFKTEFY